MTRIKVHANRSLKITGLYLLIFMALWLCEPAWGIDKLTIGIFPRRDPTLTMLMFTPLGDYLSEKLHIPVTVETAADFNSFMDRVKSGRYNLVHLNQYQYTQIHRDYGYEAIAQNEEQGEEKIRGALFVKADSPIRSVPELRGKTIAFGGGKDAMMSYIVPTYLLQQAGLHRGDYRERFAISPPNSLLAVYLGQVDAAGAGEIVQRLKVITSRIPPDSIRTIAVSEPLPHLPWAVRPDIADQLRERLTNLLTHLNNSESGKYVLQSARMTGINAVNDHDYDVHRKIIAQIRNERAR